MDGSLASLLRTYCLPRSAVHHATAASAWLTRRPSRWRPEQGGTLLWWASVVSSWCV